MEEFALGIFANSDKADRESPVQPPDKSLAGRFYISSLFFDVLTQFYSDRQLPPDLEQKRRYAKYRTIQIKKGEPLDVQSQEPTTEVVAREAPRSAAQAGTAGVKTGGPKTGFQYADSGSSDESPSRPTPPVVPKQVRVSAAPRAPPVARGESVGELPASPSGTVSRGDALNAKKKLQQAISAIDFADYPTAGKLCSESLSLLGFKN
jgi:hypothetical protein